MQVPAGARRMVAGAPASTFLVVGVLLILFPLVTSTVLRRRRAGDIVWLAGFAIARRRRRRRRCCLTFPLPLNLRPALRRMGRQAKRTKGWFAKTLAGERTHSACSSSAMRRRHGGSRGGLLGDPDDADDAAQGRISLRPGEARAVRYSPPLRPVVDAHRGQRGDGPAATPQRAAGRAPRPSMVGGGPRPDAAAIRSELGARLQTALGQLPSAAGWQWCCSMSKVTRTHEIAGILRIRKEPYDRKCFTRVAVYARAG